ncbi:aminoglycoside 6-adenylyltransferase [Dyadobacter fermentans]|uniref:DNA polymerase, beta domain protein region n=1 Tax=Dyadobacter fermentans (strain ATCC 700827 / DSM 18053 / CIP 107007 / KCTC 52180 / NS114) TaxID=471854 RepID=C6VZR6_DYAFD|nr:aminoglycoside 6-adenylyltransferase [Dyadobacter fermentans]ACT93544.1 DNA polymerase, beta domain protein region [Dyadobacter fermentans DSM 18053]
MIPYDYQKFVDSLRSHLQSNIEFLGLAVGGSWIDNQLDSFSDIDLILVHRSPQIPMADRRALAKAFGNLLACFSGEHVGEPRLLICLYDNPILHVDLKFVAMTDMSSRIEEPIILWERDNMLTAYLKHSQANFPFPDFQWIEDRFWVWIHYAAAKIGRGELFETLTFFSFIQQTVLGPLLLIRNGLLPKGVRKLEMLLPKEDLLAMQATIAKYDQISCLEALKNIIDLYLSLRESVIPSSVVRQEHAEARVKEYVNNFSF